MVVVTNLIGYVAAVVGTFLMLPQVLKSHRTKNVGNLSMATVILYVINCFLWLVYGSLISAWPVIIANGVALIISVAQLFLKLKHEVR